MAPAGCNNVSFTNCKQIIIPGFIAQTDTADLVMRDCWNDIGNEPNETCNMIGWYDIWGSPDLWNRRILNSPDSLIHQQPVSATQNRLMFRVKNNANGNGCASSDPAKITFYWTVASTGEMWPNDWIYPVGSGQLCKIGDSIGTATIPPIGSQEEYVNGINWLSPYHGTWVACSNSNYEVGDSIEICFLARLRSPNDPINNEVPGAIAANVINSNNIVTRNTFLLDVSIDGGMIGDTPPPKTKYILIRNNNTSNQTLNLTVKNLLNTSISAGASIELVLTPGIWEKWVAGGKQSTGLSEVRQYVLKINNLATAKLKNLSFAANEAHYLGIRVSNGTGKFDFNANSNIKLQITHESANNTPINASSACIFDIKFGKNDNNSLSLPNGLQATIISNLVYNTLLLNILSNEITEASICIYNTQGQLVKLNKKQVLQIGLNEQSFEVSNLHIGLYTIVIQTNKNVVSKKFIKL